jgi:ATP-dependent RNA helicase DeaD
VHRIGRVGRAGREGVAITLAEPREQRLMRNVEQLTKRRIEIAPIPSVADLRAHRMESVRAALYEELVGDELDGFRTVVESLSGEFDAERVAMAAVKLLAESQGPEPEEVIPPFAPGGRFGEHRDERRGGPRGDRFPRDARGARDHGPREHGPRDDRGRPGMARVFIGGGREMGIRPQDIVGAITGEAGISGGEIGAITISDRFSLVEIPEGIAKMVVGALRGRPVKGRKVLVRLERSAEDAPARPREAASGRPVRARGKQSGWKPPGRGRRYP